jgi:Sec-independent protein translocase protein TatA
MSVFKILLYAFLIYLGYKIIFEFIIPVYRTTRQVKKQFREMNERMKEHMRQQQGDQFAPEKEPQTTKEKPGDYIEFEEIK